MINIYVLKLEDNKYYIGKTSHLNFRLDDHFSSNGSVWTQEYKPVDILEVLPNCDDEDEDKYTLKYMKKYGINNVRGGSFCQKNLSESNKATLKQMINGNSDRCYICGSTSHFANDCRNDVDKIKCYKCGRDNHTANKCYARTSIRNKIKCYKCGRDNHTADKCYARTSIRNKIKCYKCGRDNHTADKCYARTYK